MLSGQLSGMEQVLRGEGRRDDAQADSRDAIFNSNPHIAVMFNDEYEVIDCNPSAMRFFEYEDKQNFIANAVPLLKNLIPAYQSTGRRSIPLENRLAAAAEKGRCEFTTELVVKGAMVAFNVIMKRIPFGETFSIVAYMIRRREIEDRVQLMLDTMPLANLFLSERKFALTDCNMEAVRVFGFSGKEEFLDRYTEILPDMQPDGSNSLMRMREKLSRASESGRISFEFMFKAVDGEKLPAEVTLINVNWHNSEAFLCYVRDLRRVKEAEEKLYVHSNLLQIVNNISVMLINNDDTESCDEVIRESLRVLGVVAGVDRAYIWENFEQDGKACGRMLYEWSRRERPLKDVDFTGQLYYDDYPFWKGAVFGGKTVNMLVKDMPHAEKRLFEEQLVKSVLMIPITNHGQLWGFIGFDDCKSERTFAKGNEQVLQSGAALIVSRLLRYRMIHSLVEAREAALASARAKSEFLSRMSHEIRTPMNAIVGMTRLAQQSGNIDIIKRYLNTVESSSEQLLGIINDVLDMSRIDSGKVEAIYEEFDFEKMTKKVAAMVRAKFHDKRIGFNVEYLLPFTRAVIGDELHISQILINLLDNAAKFTPSGGEVMLKISWTRISGGQPLLRLEVSDNGCGVPDGAREKIFQQFEQGDGGTARKYGGTGLGLAICKRLADIMGGSIRVESEEGHGANFIVELGIEWGKKFKEEREASVSPRQEAAGGAEPESSEYDFSGKRILLAEDIEINRNIIALFLEKTGIVIDNAENGVQAVEMYSAAPDKYAAILMDVQMPLLDGLNATRRIRASGLPTAQTIPIIAMTANAFKEDEKMSIEAGMNRHVTKPVDTDNLLKVLAEALWG